MSSASSPSSKQFWWVRRPQYGGPAPYASWTYIAHELHLVERLARLLSLPVKLVSQVGRGSMFAIDIPRGTFKDMAVASVVPATPERAKHEALFVAVIDDDETILDATRALLEQWGCTVITAGSCAGALAQLTTATRAPDALICDYHLRAAESGVDVIRAVQAEFNCDIPALLITGETSAECLREMRAHGLPVLHKPVDEHTLRRALWNN